MENFQWTDCIIADQCVCGEDCGITLVADGPTLVESWIKYEEETLKKQQLKAEKEEAKNHWPVDDHIEPINELLNQGAKNIPCSDNKDTCLYNIANIDEVGYDIMIEAAMKEPMICCYNDDDDEYKIRRFPSLMAYSFTKESEESNQENTYEEELKKVSDHVISDLERIPFCPIHINNSLKKRETGQMNSVSDEIMKKKLDSENVGMIYPVHTYSSFTKEELGQKYRFEKMIKKKPDNGMKYAGKIQYPVHIYNSFKKKELWQNIRSEKMIEKEPVEVPQLMDYDGVEWLEEEIKPVKKEQPRKKENIDKKERRVKNGRISKADQKENAPLKKITIREAIFTMILESPKQYLKLSDIYEQLEARYPNLSRSNSYQNSFRHGLSHGPFSKLKEDEENGCLKYCWAINPRHKMYAEIRDRHVRRAFEQRMERH